MGFLAGVVSEINRQEDAKERADQFMRELLEKRKATVLPILMDRIEKRNAVAKERAGRVKTAIRYGFTKEAASILESSGELDLILGRLGKLADDPDTTIKDSAITRMSEAVVANVPPEKISAAVNYALDNGYAEAPSSDKLIEAIYANTQEDFETAIQPLMSAATSAGPTSPSIGRIGVNPAAITPISETKRNQIRTNLEKSLASQLKGSVDAQTGNIVWQDPVAAGKIIQQAQDYYIQQMTDPIAQRDSEDIYSDIFDSVTDLLRTYDLKEIADMDDFTPLPPIQGPIKKKSVTSADVYDESLKN